MNETTAAVEGPQWTATASIWAEHWTRLSDPARELIADRTAIGPEIEVLDMGCGSGEFLALAAARGATVSGIDAADGMLALARQRLERADLRRGAIEHLPWPDDSFHVVTSFNSFQFAAERLAPFREAARVARPGGLVAVCVWGPRERNDLPPLFDAIREFANADEDVSDEPRLGDAGVLESCAVEAGLGVRETGDVPVPYEAADSEVLVAALELDLVHSGVADRVDRGAFKEVVKRAAAPNRRPDGSYRFENAFRWLIAEA